MPTSIPTPTPVPPRVIVREDLPGMVLAQADVDAEIQGLPLDVAESGYQDNDGAASGTVDPSDTASDLTALGRLDGYGHQFLDLLVLLQGDPAAGGIFNVSASVDTFDSPEGAAAFIQDQIEDFRRLQSSEISEGFTLTRLQESTPPNVGEDAIAGVLLISVDVPGLKADTSNTFVSWRRDNVVATLTVAAVGDGGKGAVASRLALRMDQRIDGVLAGDIVATPVPSGPGPSGTAEERARGQGYDLPAMLHTIADLPEGVALGAEGFIENSDGISAYQRSFEPAEGQFMELASSRAIGIGETVTLHISPLDAQAPLLLMRNADPEDIRNLAVQALAGSEFSVTNLTVAPLPVFQVGDVTVAFLMKFDTEFGPFEGHLFFFAQGRLAVDVVITGVADRIALFDTLNLAQFISGKIPGNSP